MPIVTRVHDGSSCDVAAGASRLWSAGLGPDERTVRVHDLASHAELLRTRSPHPLMYLRLAVTELRRVGLVGVVGSGEEADFVWAFLGSAWRRAPLGKAWSSDPALIRAAGEEFEVAAVVERGGRIAVWHEDGRPVRHLPASTSQGLCQHDEEGRIVTLDERIDAGRGVAVGGVVLLRAARAGDWWAGQCTVGTDHLRVVRETDGHTFELFRPHGHSPHIAGAGDVLAVAIRGRKARLFLITPPYPASMPPGAPVVSRPPTPAPTPVPAPVPTPSPPSPPKEAHMDMPPDVLATFRAFARRFPPPEGEPGGEHEERCRQWTRRLAEQLCFSHSPAWGHKSAGTGRPPSKDAIARQTPGQLDGWDVLIAAGSGRPKVARTPAYHDLRGQAFIRVPPVDHLGEGPATEPTPVTEPATEPPISFDESLAVVREAGRKWRQAHLPALQDTGMVDEALAHRWLWRLLVERWTRQRLLGEIE